MDTTRKHDDSLTARPGGLAALRDNLWNSPPISPDMLSDEQKAKYVECGEHMYGNIDMGNIESSVNDQLAYIVLQLKSGLHHTYLSGDDRMLMDATYGDGWETRFSPC